MNLICPFHKDNNASFSLKKNNFFCYGCNSFGKFKNTFKIKKFDIFFDKNIIIYSKKKLYNKNFWLNYLLFRKINMKTSLNFNLGIINFFFKKINSILFNRLIFPIFNENNILLGIGLKTNNNKNKYINLFKKESNINHIFFGINNIKNFNFVIIVEGYFDLLTIYKNNFKNVISILGCCVNENKIDFLLSKFKKIYFCFDGDYAGFKASEKIKYYYNKKNRKRIYSKTMPKNFDPDNFINIFGINSFLNYLKK